MKIRSYKGQFVRLAHKCASRTTIQNVVLRNPGLGPVEKWDCLGSIYEVDNRDVLGREFATPVQEPIPDRVVKLERVEREIKTLDEIEIDPVVEHSALRGHGG